MRPRPLPLALAAVALAGAFAAWLLAPRLVPGLGAPASAPRGTLPSLGGLEFGQGGGPLTADSLRGRPVALLLWSDADPRGLAALAVAEAWHRAYGPLGARIVAVREPEFAALAAPGVAASVARRLALTLPYADDPTNRLAGSLGGASDGPRLIVADERGHVVVDSVGALEPGDAALRAWAARAHPDMPLPPALAEALPAGVRTLALGAGQVRGGPLESLPAGRALVFTAEFRYEEQGRAWTPYPVGGWRVEAGGVSATRAGAANFMAIRYSAGRVGVVASPPPGGSARLWILRDEQWPKPADRGDDVRSGARGEAWVLVDEPRLYWIDKGAGERVLKLSPDEVGVTLHAFVFEDAVGGEP